MKLSFYAKTDEIDKILERLSKVSVARVDSKFAQSFCKNKAIKQLRDKDNLFVGWDKKKRTSILYIPHRVKIRKKGSKYFFDYF